MVALVMFLLWPAVEKQKPPPDDGKKRLPVVRDQPEATPRWDWGNGPKPALLVRLRSLDALGERASLFGKAIEHQEVFDQFQNSLAQALAPAGRPAINWNRPWAVYTLPDKQFAQDFVALIPIPAPENFLELVENSKMRVIKNKEGTYTFDQIPVVQISNLQVGQFPVQLPQLKAFQLTCRFIEGYVCLSSNPLALQDGKLLKPEVVFADKVPAAFTASYFLDDQLLTAKTVRTWQDTADILLEQMKQKDSPVAKQFLDMTKQVGLNLGVKELAIPPDNLAFARRLFHLTTNGLLDLVQQGEEISFRLDIKPTSENLEMELLFRAKENSNLAKTITSFGTWPSLFGGLRDDHAEFNIAIHFKLPDEVCQAIAPYVRASTAQVLKENQNDPFLPMGEKFLRTCEAAVLGGELDLALSLRRDDKGKINVVGGFKLNNAQQLEEVFKEEWKHLAPRDQQRFKFDLVRVDDVNIHQINTTDYLPQLLLTTVGKVFFYHAFRQDAVMWSMGESGLELLKEAVQAKPQPGPLLLVGGNALWNANNKQSRFSFALEGGDALRFRHTLDLSFVAFVYKLMQQHQR
jgi:hypothetical protein